MVEGIDPNDPAAAVAATNGIFIDQTRQAVITTAIGMVMMTLDDNDYMPIEPVLMAVDNTLMGFFRDEALTTKEKDLIAIPWINRMAELSVAFDDQRRKSSFKNVIKWSQDPT